MNQLRRNLLYLSTERPFAGAIYDPNSAERLLMERSFIGEELQVISDWGKCPRKDMELEQQFISKIRNMLDKFEGNAYLIKSSGEPSAISRVQRYKGPFVNSATLKHASIFSKDTCVQNNSSILTSTVLLSPEMFLDGIDEAFSTARASIVLTSDLLESSELASKVSQSVECKHGNLVHYELVKQLADINAIVMSINRGQDNILRLYSSTNDIKSINRMIDTML
jgi:hypothetical protein